MNIGKVVQIEKMGSETDFSGSFESVTVVYEDYDIEKKVIEKDILQIVGSGFHKANS